MKKMLIICGPTVTGKTKLGTQLAKKFNGEIISADSRQVYRGMDIGTGKDLDKFTIYPPAMQACKALRAGNLQFTIDNLKIGYYEVEGAKIWLLDIVSPDYKFNVADYKKCAEVVIKDVLKRGKLPIVVGGTGFYIKALTEGIGTIGVEPDWELRQKLQKCKVSELQRILRDYNPELLDSARGKLRRRMNESDRQNPRRLIRAIEIALESQKSKVKNQKSNSKLKMNKLFIGLNAPYEILYKRIDQRVEERVKMGLEGEIRSLLKRGYDWENSALGTTLAYSEWRDYIEGKAPKDEVVQKWKFDEHGYARRQMTWFKKNNRINWFDIFDIGWQEKVEKLVSSWYS